MPFPYYEFHNCEDFLIRNFPQETINLHRKMPFFIDDTSLFSAIYCELR